MKTFLLFVSLFIGIAASAIAPMMILFPEMQFIPVARGTVAFVILVMCCFFVADIVIELGKKK